MTLFIDTFEAAAILGVTRKTVGEYVKRGLLREVVFKNGKRKRVKFLRAETIKAKGRI